MALDLTTFKPETVGQLFDGLVSEVSGILGTEWSSAEADVKTYLDNIAHAAFNTTAQLAAGRLTQDQAKMQFKLQELGLKQVLLYSQLLGAVAAQKVVNGVFAVIIAAVKNVTGIDINWITQEP